MGRGGKGKEGREGGEKAHEIGNKSKKKAVWRQGVPPWRTPAFSKSFSAVYDESPMPKPKRRTEPEAPQLSPTQLQAIMDTAGPDDVPPIVGSVGARAVSWEDRPAMSRANYEATRALA